MTKSDRTFRTDHPAPTHRVVAINICEAKTRPSQLVYEAAAGNDVVVSRNGKPLVRITQLHTRARPVTFGLLKGRLTVPADFDAPLPDSVLNTFEGR